MLIKRIFHYNNGRKDEYQDSSKKSVDDLGVLVSYRGVSFSLAMHDNTVTPPEAHYGEISEYKKGLFKRDFDEVLSGRPVSANKCSCGSSAVGSNFHSYYCDADEDLDLTDDDNWGNW